MIIKFCVKSAKWDYQKHDSYALLNRFVQFTHGPRIIFVMCKLYVKYDFAIRLYFTYHHSHVNPLVVWDNLALQFNHILYKSNFLEFKVNLQCLLRLILK